MSERATAGEAFQAFVELIARLRGPGGCPWDREQTHESLKPMTIEEAYEVALAIDDGDAEHLASELGDLLLQVVFHSQVGADSGRFTVLDVIRGVSDKMVRRHPHVFGDAQAGSPAEVLRNWEAIKEAETAQRGTPHGERSMLDGVSTGLPAVIEAYQLATKVSRVGFDWPDAASALRKLDEEARELQEVASAGAGDAALAGEVGDLLFTAVAVARRVGVDPESALKAANRKFRRRFRHIEDRLRSEGRRPADATLEEMDALWDEAKTREPRHPLPTGRPPTEA